MFDGLKFNIGDQLYLQRPFSLWWVTLAMTTIFEDEFLRQNHERKKVQFWLNLILIDLYFEAKILCIIVSKNAKIFQPEIRPHTF